jgi:hypothetical protein
LCAINQRNPLPLLKFESLVCLIVDHMTTLKRLYETELVVEHENLRRVVSLLRVLVHTSIEVEGEDFMVGFRQLWLLLNS